MTSNQHTPGPWYATFDGDLPKVREWASDAVLAVADDGGHVDPAFALDRSIIEANARLIASAPVLLEALKATMERERRRYESSDVGQRFFRENNAAALTAIAKATGESA